MIIWRNDDWAIAHNIVLDGYCLRHTEKHDFDGHCACGGRCKGCEVDAPDEVVGFFALVEWKR